MQKSDWKKCKLGDVCSSSNTGLDAIRRAPIVEEDTGLKCLRIQDISQHKDFCLWGNTRVSDIDKEKFLIQKDDIFVARTGATVGCNYIVMQNFPAVFNNGLIRLKIKKDIEPLYVFYNLQGAFFRDYIRGIAFGTVAQPNIKIRDLLNFTLNLPPLEEQKRIAQILGSLDDKIELLQKQNKTLEDMAKAIFKSWFVDFDVVHAKQKGLPKADIMREYHLTDELYDLFPSGFEPSALGPIPHGWQVKPLSKIATFLNGLALQKYPARAEEDFLPIIKIAELRNGISSSTDKANTDLPAEYIVLNGDILFSWSGSLMVKIWSGGKGALNQHLFKVFSNDYPKWFYYLWVNHYLPMFQEIAADKATTMGHIQRKHLDQAMVVAPTDLKPFTQYFDALIDKQILNNKQIQTLTELRDTLLPPLISGKIRV